MGYSDRSTLGRILTWIVVGIIALFVIRIAVWILRATLGIALILLFTVGPILLVGWLTVTIFKRFRDNPA